MLGAVWGAAGHGVGTFLHGRVPEGMQFGVQVQVQVLLECVSCAVLHAVGVHAVLLQPVASHSPVQQGVPRFCFVYRVI